MSEVESHCSDSGQTAQQAFGDPVEYARSLRLPVDDDDHSTRAIMRSLAPIVVQMVGMSMLNWGFEDWLRGQQFEITTGHLVNASVVLLGTVAVARFADPMFRMAVYHPIRGAILMTLALMVSGATCVAALMLLDGVIWRVSAGWCLATGAAVLVGGVAWATARLRAHDSEEDPITSPFEEAGSPPSSEATAPLRRLSGPSWLATFPYVALIPLGTLLLLSMTLVLHQMSGR